MRFDSDAERKAAIQRLTCGLTSRGSESLARFIASLSFNPGPLAEHVKTFIVGDNLSEATTSLKERIDALRLSRLGDYHCGAERELGQRLEYILNDIETLILPFSPATAFDLLVQVIECDGDVFIQCRGYIYLAETAVTHAATLLALAAKSLPNAEVRKVVQRLIAEDTYGTRLHVDWHRLARE